MRSTEGQLTKETTHDSSADQRIGGGLFPGEVGSSKIILPGTHQKFWTENNRIKKELPDEKKRSTGVPQKSKGKEVKSPSKIRLH